jgi:3-hydroxybutyryl-CoA dehydrogenase
MEIQGFGVIGAGQMGRGIAQTAAQTGWKVALVDASQELADKGKERIQKDLGRLVEKGKIDTSKQEEILGRIETSDRYAAFADADIVVEAATESFDVKRQIFERADQAMKSDAILASNTSSISLTRLASVTGRPDRVVGMHFMNPVPVMKLVEVIRAMQTGDDTYAQTRELAEAMGKTVVSAKDMPGFVVNRMLIPFLNEACFALQEGLGTIEEMDAAIKLGLNHPMGPFELSDLVGLDTVLFIAEVLHRDFGEDKYRPAPMLRNYVAAGWLGRKAGRGFYEYDEKGKRK